jgi:calcium-dependent protein kinase
MHQTLKIAHRDVKAENVLFKYADKNNMTVKLCDFGFATQFRDNNLISGVVGSPYYIAPEIFQGTYDYRCDLWSVGVLLYFMLSHTYPFRG